ncbi:hypothetical protein RRG08_066903 [Elysia crispata]|uniref:C-type lectin domain-containing protein n=1 Tax=Elysia crispata TaxID=231223 RepID=A0AAE0Z259_9GAST|nr:hypothetical protein RRG08_066903 [Elysia crispata]
MDYFVDPQEKCNLKRYNFEYPCKYSDYFDLREARACVKVIKNPLSWREANWRCGYYFNGTLVKITSKVLDDDISDLIKSSRGTLNYWIGLSSLKLKQLLPVGFSWLDETEPTTYSNWHHYTPRTKPSHSFLREKCASKDEISGEWFEEDCYPTKHPFICQKVSARNPGPPSLDLNFAPGHKFAYIGYEMVAKCTAFTEMGAVVQFRLGDALGFTAIDGDLDHYGIKFTVEDGRFVKMDDRCFLKIKATMTVKLTKKLLGTNLSCCWYFQNSFASCSDIIPTNLRCK